MPKPGNRTRSNKRDYRRLPGGRGRTHYKLEVGAPLLCRSCGQPLAGVSHGAPLQVRRLSRTRKRVWRPYGGQFCHKCLQISLKEAARAT